MYRRSSFTYATPFCSVYAQVLVVVQQPEEQSGSWLIRLADSDTAVVSAQFQTRLVTGVAMTAVIHTLYFIILAGFIPHLLVVFTQQLEILVTSLLMLNNIKYIFSHCPGDDSGKVTIWNMAPVKNEEDEMNENVPKLLCQMDNHFGGFDAIFFLTFSQNIFLLLKQYVWINNNDDNKNDDDNDDDDDDGDGDGDHWSSLPLYPFF